MAKSKSKLKNSQAKNIPGYIICTLWVAITFVILGYVAVASLSQTKDIFAGTVFKFGADAKTGVKASLNWGSYKTAWQSQKLYLFFLNSLLYATVSVVAGVAMSAPAAYILSRYRFRGNNLLKRLLLLCLSLPSIMLILPLYSLILKLDIEGRLALIIIYSCMRVPYTTIFLLNFFETISKSYEEAAAIDGCPSGKIFTKIMLPMVRPAIATVALFGFLGILNEYMLSLILCHKDEALSLGVGLSRVITAMKYNGNYPALFAAVFIVVAPSVIIYAFTARKIMYGGMGGGVKG